MTVALSGLGGDEMFCGYERYLGFQMSQVYNKIPGLVRENIVRRLIEWMSGIVFRELHREPYETLRQVRHPRTMQRDISASYPN